mgnify:CR=1 FL=1
MDFTLLGYTFLAVFIVSLISLIGVLTLLIKKGWLEGILHLTVSFAAGALLAAAFFDLIPEVVEEAGGFTVGISFFILLGILVSLVIERGFNWYHCHHHHHNESCHKHEIKSFTYLNLIGDGIHNFLDGMILATAFIIDIRLGIITTIAVALHEIPQEIGDFSILLYGGMSRLKALFYNFLTALTSFLGAAAVFFASSYTDRIITPLAAFAAGGFIYIAGVDLLPELKNDHDTERTVLEIFFLILGMAVIGVATIFLE